MKDGYAVNPRKKVHRYLPYRRRLFYKLDDLEGLLRLPCLLHLPFLHPEKRFSNSKRMLPLFLRDVLERKLVFPFPE